MKGTSRSGSADSGNLRTKKKKKKNTSQQKLKNNRRNTNFEPNIGQLFWIHQKSSIKHERRLVHVCVYFLPINILEFPPFGGNDHGFSMFTRLQGGAAYRNLFFDLRRKW